LLSPVDNILEHIGLPKTKVVLDAVSPQNVLGNKLGLTSPGEILEGVVEDIDGSTHGGKLPGLPELPRMR
jgi:hypothetical protein